MKPEPLLSTDRGQRGEVVGGAGIDGAGIPDDAEGAVARRPVGPYRGAQRGDLDLVRRKALSPSPSSSLDFLAQLWVSLEP